MSATDRSSIARHRLDLVTAPDPAPDLAPEPAPGPAPAPDPGWRPSPHPRVHRPHPQPQEPAPDEPKPEPERAADGTGRPRPRGWRERWLPESWRGARVDPGRRGSVALAGVAAAAAVLAAVGVWRDRPVPQAAPALPAVAAAAVTSHAPETTKRAAPITVSVAGAVVKPGLVTLPAGARVADALAAAGGAVKGTNLMTVNLARSLADGEQVLVGVDGPPVSGGGVGGVSGTGAAGGGSTGPGSDAPVNLNTAGEAELEKLPGVGPVMAAAIITYREDHGGFSRVEQLTDVSGIGDARFSQLKDLVRV